MSNSYDKYFHIRINRNLSVAVIVSLLAHMLMLFYLSQQDLLNQHQPIASQIQTMVVQLNQNKPAEAAATPPVEVQQPPVPPPIPQHRTPVVKPPPMPVPAPVPLPNHTTILAEPAKPVPPIPTPAPVTDMMSYVNAAREKRRLAGEEPDHSYEDSARREHAPSEDEIRMAKIKRNLQPSGTNGLFQITSMDSQTATIAFRGWKSELSYSHREMHQVTAGPDGDIGRAVVRKMIEIIRRYNTGDFNWESQRLGRVVVLSARLQDNDGLEDFLMQEFFSSPGIPAQ